MSLDAERAGGYPSREAVGSERRRSRVAFASVEKPDDETRVVTLTLDRAVAHDLVRCRHVADKVTKIVRDALIESEVPT